MAYNLHHSRPIIDHIPTLPVRPVHPNFDNSKTCTLHMTLSANSIATLVNILNGIAYIRTISNSLALAPRKTAAHLRQHAVAR